MVKLAAVLTAALCALVLLVSGSSAASGDVILLHGWNGTAADWANAKSAYEAQGYTVHALQLPRDGSRLGDTAINADYVQQYMTTKGITSVRLDSHSLGGWLALTIAFSRDDPRVSSVVLRDSGYGSGLGCWLVPDLCSGSAIVTAVENTATAADPIPVLHLSSESTVLPGVDCTKKISGYNHAQYQTSSVISATAAQWPGVSPCAAATPTPTPTPTASATPTPTPSCSWLQRLWGLCG